MDDWIKGLVDARAGACAAGKDSGGGMKGNGVERAVMPFVAAVVGIVASAVMGD